MGLKHKYKYIYALLILLGTLFLSPSLLAQQRLKVYEDYIKTYSPIAVQNMKEYKIPASITLAQGLLESGAGKSNLAQRSNNHFGIKCHHGWRGAKVYAADDTPNDCFRKYRNVSDSYADHAQFLATGPRYQHLFKLNITDYRGWARGLQQSGYATDRAYANKLIKLIEDYQLYNYDNPNYNKGLSRRQRRTARKEQAAKTSWTHQPYITHGLVYVVARTGDTFTGIADEFGFREKNLLKYNDVPEDFPLNDGDIVYFEKKKARADLPYTQHVVQIGESMHSISQKYGIQLRNLYRLNKRSYSYIPQEGDVIKLR